MSLKSDQLELGFSIENAKLLLSSGVFFNYQI